ncbi:MAG: integrase [Rhodanobacteraceae bacterium]|nr:integrase [Rhodanobacteraceae bacterium]
MSIEAYRHYRRACKTVPFQGSYMPYRWGGLPQRLHVRWMAYNEFFNTFASELANAINQLTNTVHRLRCWAVVLPQLSDRLRVEALMEFVDPHATVALSLPYAIRSRFVLATAHLCHQANQAMLGQAWKDDLRSDEKIVFQDADEKGREWKQYLPLKAALEQISNAQHRSDTGNFRNAFQHQMPPHVALGLSGLMRRTVDPKTGAARYEAGETQPLGVGDIATALASQAEACQVAFSRFQELVREHEGEIIRANTEDLARLG